MSQFPPNQPPMPVGKPPKSKTLLYISLACFAIAIMGVLMVVWGTSRLSGGVGRLAEQASELDPEKNPDRVIYELNVPGETACHLPKDDYLIWVQWPGSIWSTESVEGGHEGDEPAGGVPPALGEGSEGAAADGGGSEEDAQGDARLASLNDLPDVQWKVIGPNDTGASVYKEGGNLYGKEVAVAGFRILNEGDYVIRAELDRLPEGVSYRVYNDVMEEQLEQAAQSVGSMASGFLLIFVGGGLAGLAGLMGLILLIVYFTT